MKTEELTVEDEIQALKQEAEAQDAGEPLPSETAAKDTPAGSEETEVESDEGLTQDNSEDEAVEAASETEEEVKDEAKAEIPEDNGEAVEGEPEAEPNQRVEKKKQALKRSWENADKRHREADERDQLLRQRESELLQREQKVAQVEAEIPDDPLPKYSVDEIASSLNEFIDDGDFDTAKGLVTNMAAKAKAMQTAGVSNGPGSKAFNEAWEQVRLNTIKKNPDLDDPKTSLYVEATDLLNGQWGNLFSSHPAGVAAAVEVAKLRMGVASSSELSDKVQALTKENNKLKKASALDGTQATSRGEAPDKWDSLSLDDQLDAIRAEAAALS